RHWRHAHGRAVTEAVVRSALPGSQPLLESLAVTGVGKLAAEAPGGSCVVAVSQKRFGNGDGENGVVCEPGPSREEREVFDLIGFRSYGEPITSPAIGPSISR